MTQFGVFFIISKNFLDSFFENGPGQESAYAVNYRTKMGCGSQENPENRS